MTKGIEYCIKYFLVFFTVIFFLTQAHLQFSRLINPARDWILIQKTEALIDLFKLRLTLTHMFAPFETSTWATRLVFHYADGRKLTRTQVTYRAPFRRSLSNLIEARLILRSSNAPGDRVLLGFVRYQCRNKLGIKALEFQKARYHIADVLSAHGRLMPQFTTITRFECETFH